MGRRDRGAPENRRFEMTRGRRIALIALAVAAAVIAFVIARPGGDDDETDANPSTTQQVTGTTISEETVATTEEAVPETAPATTEAPPPESKPKPITVRTRDAKPVGGVRELTVTSGETVRLVVTSNVPEEVHVHGYDLSKDVGPGKPARFRFRADLEGIFEIELEEAGEPIVELRVEP
jgi:heme/copper-type cytochrome/quinol oxidase subunit 2